LTWRDSPATLKTVRAALPAAAVLVVLVALALAFGFEVGFFDGH
jgi:hypothetical protein